QARHREPGWFQHPSRLSSSRKPWQTPAEGNSVRRADSLVAPFIPRRHHPGASSLPQGGPQVLGANLKCSESRCWACPSIGLSKVRTLVSADVARDHASALAPHQPGRYSASSLLARRSARSIAAAKSASTAFLLILRRKKSAHRNSLNGVVSLAKPPARRSSPARLRNGSSFNCMTVFGISAKSRRRPCASKG